MKFDTYVPLAPARTSSSGTADPQTTAIPDGASAAMITVETTSARVTFDGSDPSAASAPSMVIPKDSLPVLVQIGPGATIKHCAASAAASVLQVAFFA